MTTRAEERAPRESEARTPDTGASDQFSAATAEPGRRDESGRAGRYPGNAATDEPDGIDVVMERKSDAPEAAEPADTPDAPAGQAEIDQPQGSSGRDSGDSWDWAEENIVPEGLRSER